MKKILTLSLATAFGITALAQQQRVEMPTKRVCGTLEHEKYLESLDPTRAQRKAEYQKAVAKWLEMRKNDPAAKNQTTVMIPLVVHVVFSGPSDSVTDAQIFSQIQILNEDFTRTNADAANTPAAFASVGSGPMVNYCWAQRDPNGNATNGIERRKNTTTTTWSTNDAVKSFSSGGLDAWDPSKYFNIWVCRLSAGLLGYGEFPTGSLSNTYGFVATYTAFGNTGFAQAPFNGGRTATHEIGHCFNLFHIWGDDGSACTGSDQCADTPNQSSENYNCPTYPHTDACSGSAPGVMFMNYMDYTDDACMNIFTVNQSSRMTAVINNPPYNSLLTSNACTPVVVTPLDAGISAIASPAGSLGCTATFTPSVTLKNFGTSTLTSCTINYKVDNGTPSTYAWSGSLATNATAAVTLPAVTGTAGTHTFTAYTSAPNGGADGQASNDSYSSNFSINATTGAAIPWSEDFESSTSLPTGWTLSNPDNDAAWQVNTTVGLSSAHSMGFNNCDGDGATDMTGRIDKVYTTGFNLGSVTTATMTFDVSYAPLLYQGQQYDDQLQIYASTDCGQTWTSLYNKAGSTLASAPTMTTIASCYAPTGPSQWRNDAINLNSYAGQTNVMFAFENTSQWGEWIYIDNINIQGTIGIKSETAAIGVSIQPNPNNGVFQIVVQKNQHEVSKVSVYDMLGKKVHDLNQKIAGGETATVDLSHLSNGTYFVEIVKDGKPSFSKIVINK